MRIKVDASFEALKPPMHIRISISMINHVFCANMHSFATTIAWRRRTHACAVDKSTRTRNCNTKAQRQTNVFTYKYLHVHRNIYIYACIYVYIYNARYLILFCKHACAPIIFTRRFDPHDFHSDLQH